MRKYYGKLGNSRKFEEISKKVYNEIKNEYKLRNKMNEFFIKFCSIEYAN